MSPQPGDYGLARTSGLMGYLIRIGTLSKWNHAFIHIGDGHIIEARPTGVSVGSLKEYKPGPYNRNDVLTDDQRAQIVEAAKSFVGRPYGFLDILVLSLAVFGIRPKWVMNQVSREDRMICSQVVAQAYDDAGVPLLDEPAFLVTPAALANRLIEGDVHEPASQ